MPLRFTYDNNYFNDRFQGSPIGGYTQIVEKMLKGADVVLEQDYFDIAKNQGVKVKLLDDIKTDNSFDVVVEATGSVSGFETSLSLVKPRGVLVLKSTIATGKELNLAPIVINEITVLGSRCGQFKPALNLLKNKRIDFKPFISEIYSVDKAIEAFEANKRKDTIKILLKF